MGVQSLTGAGRKNHCLGGFNLRHALLRIFHWLPRSLRSPRCPDSPPPSAHPCLATLDVAAGYPEWVSLQDINVPLRQHSLAKSCSLPHAGDWLNTVPSSSLGLHFMDREFLQYWLGVPIFEEGVKCGVCHSAARPSGWLRREW